MRTILTLLCFLRIAYSAAIAQSSGSGVIPHDTISTEKRPLLADMYYPQLTPDSIRISFSQSPVAHISAADGFYAIPEAYGSSILKKKPDMGLMTLIQPAKLFGRDSVLQITAHPEWSLQAPYYEFRSAKYPYLNRHTVKEHENEFRRIRITESHSETNGVVDGVMIASPDESDTISFVYRDSTGRENRITEYYVKYESFFDRTDSLMHLLDTQYEQYRADVLQPHVTQLLTPFYMSRIEIRNSDYRQFVRWVADSIAFAILYDSLPPEQALELLDITKAKMEQFHHMHGRTSPVDPRLKEENLRFFGFDYHALDSRKGSFYGKELYYQYLDSFYYPQPARFYQRREINTTKLIYRSRESPTPVYPDTLCWLRDSTYSAYDPMCNMYFWHPVYDNYPVVGLSEAQMQAYCHWLTRRRNEELEDQDFAVFFTLPELVHYEMAVKASTIRSRVNTVDAYPDAPFIVRRPVVESMTFARRVFPPSEYHGNVGDEPLRKFFDWEHMNQTFPIHYLSFGVSEYCRMDDSDSLMTVLGGNRYLGVVDPHENQLNATFFQQTVPASGGSSTTGFRTIMYILPKR
jgi:hypothetical protein